MTKDQDHDWLVPVTITYRTLVFVRAATAAAAKVKAEDGDWEDDGDALREIAGWEVIGAPEEEKP